MILLVVSLLGLACQPPGQAPVSQRELQDIVRAEVASQIALAAIDGRNAPRDLDALGAEFELAVMEPLHNLQRDYWVVRMIFIVSISNCFKDFIEQLRPLAHCQIFGFI